MKIFAESLQKTTGCRHMSSFDSRCWSCNDCGRFNSLVKVLDETIDKFLENKMEVTGNEQQD